MLSLFRFFKKYWYDLLLFFIIIFIMAYTLYTRFNQQSNLDKIDEVIKETIAESLKEDTEVIEKIEALSKQIEDIEAKIEKSMEKRDEVHSAIETSFSLDDIDDIIYGGNECSD